LEVAEFLINIVDGDEIADIKANANHTFIRLFFRTFITGVKKLYL
jgi:hypothetical protein